MPEGPEIRRAVDKLSKVLLDQEPTEIFFAFEHLQPFTPSLLNDRIISVTSRSKAVLIGFEQGLTIYSHNQLYGKWRICKAGHEPNTSRQLRLAIYTDDHNALLYSASEIEVLDSDALKNHRYLQKLGPEALDETVTHQEIHQRLLQKKFYKRRLAGLLLDQSCIAGLGNYLRSEILFAAGLRSEYRPSDLTEAQLHSLSNAALTITRRAYKTRGVTVTADRVKQLKEQGLKRSNYRHFVFGREDRPCHVCGDTVHRTTAAGRRCYFCPSCQPSH